MSDPKYSASARVQVLIDIESGSNWGGDCPMSQIHKQAIEGAIGKLRQVLQESQHARGIRIVGEPKVIATLVERES